jgi:hypothetical protein
MNEQSGSFVIGTNSINAITLASTGAATFSSSVTAASIIRSGGTSSQYLMADGSVSTLSNPVTGTGTAGQVAYWSSGSAITGESNLFWDATNDRLGIGTNNPGHKLDVYGSGPVYTMIESSQQSLAALLVRNTVKTYGVGILNFNDDFNATAWGVSDLTGGSAPRLIITSGGNVIIGINTDSGDKLRVTGGNGNTFTDTITTQTPAATTKSVAWKLGTARGGTVTTNATVRVEIDGVLVDLVAKYV